MSGNRAGILLLLLAALSLAACSGGPQTATTTSQNQPGTRSADQATSDATLNVFAAASLTETFGELAEQFELGNPGVDVILNLAGSQELVTQLVENGGADVLATANSVTMAKASEYGLVTDPQLFATNTLVLITPDGNPARITGLGSSLVGAKLVICAPEVPCGQLTKKLADELGVTLQPVSEEQAVTDVRGKVTSGQADAGIVYTTDAIAAGDSVETIEIVGSEKIANEYLIAISKESSNAELAANWLELVLSEQGQKVLGAAGFTSVAK